MEIFVAARTKGNNLVASAPPSLLAFGRAVTASGQLDFRRAEALRSLRTASFNFAPDTRVNHKEELKDKIWTSTQTVENAFSLFKRGIVGNYHQLSAEHLDRYLGEFCWRYNRRRMQPWMFEMVLTNLASKKPLPYKDLTF